MPEESPRALGGVLGQLVALIGEVAAQLPEETQQQIAEGLAVLRTGDYPVDAFGFDKELTEKVLAPLMRPLYQRWFRVEVSGVEHLPLEGAGLVVANHSGTIAIDAAMTQLAIHDEHPKRRHLRCLGGDFVFELPVLGELARKSGATLACREDVEGLLAAGELVGVWPEGYKGSGKKWADRYKLQRFGRGGFVSAAVRAQVPIIPCAIVGAEEIYPIIADVPALARLLRMPYLPITPTFPWLGLLGLIPLPSKWLIEFAEPIRTDHYSPEDADDPVLVFELSDQVRSTNQHHLDVLRARRTTIFW